MKNIITALFLFSTTCFGDVLSTTGQIKFDTQMDGQTEMTLNSTGLGISVLPSSNLHVGGNAIISDQLFVGGSSGSSNLNVNGTIGFGFQTLISNATLGDQAVVLVDSSNDNILLTLPYAGNVTGRQYQIKKISTLNSVWISGGNNLIDDTNPIELPESSDLASVKLISDGMQWYKIEQKDISETVASDNLIGWWKLDGVSVTTANDSSESRVDGTIINLGSDNIGIVGKINTAVNFDGNDDYIDLSNDVAIANFGANSFSFSLWFYANSINASNYSSILRVGRQGANSQVTLQTDPAGGGRCDISIEDNSSNQLSSSQTTISLNTWYLAVGVIDRLNNKMKFYLNNILIDDVDSSSVTGSISSSDNAIIGATRLSNGTLAQYFDGKIDDLRFYNKTLESSEINALYHQGQ